MPITIPCPGCNQVLSVKDEYAGRKGKCPTCGTVVTFPTAATPAEAVTAAQVPDPTWAPAPPPVPTPAAPAYASPAALSTFPGIARGDFDVLVLVGLGVAAFFLLLLWISTMLPWRTVVFPFGRHGAETRSFAGTTLGDGRLLFCALLVMLGVVGVHFLAKRTLPIAALVVGAFGTFVFLMLLANIRSVGFGIFVGIFGAMGIIGGAVLVSIRAPLRLTEPPLRMQQPFLRDFGALIGAHGLAFVLGLLYVIIHVIAYPSGGRL